MAQMKLIPADSMKAYQDIVNAIRTAEYLKQAN